MRIKHVWRKVFIAFIGLILMCGWRSVLSAQEKANYPDTILIRISELEKTLDVIDELIGVVPAQSMNSPTAQLRGMLMGTNWIDPTRLIVMVCDFNNAQTSAAMLIPFQQSNENFQMAFKAVAGPDYYVLALPPGGTVSDAVKAVLVDASGAKATASLSVELNIRALLNKFDAQIMEGLNKLENFPQGEGNPPFGPNPQDIKTMLLKMLEVAEQVETLTMGLDLRPDKITMSYEAKASDGSELAGLFTQGGKTSFLDAYKPKQQMNFRSRSYDMTGMLNLLERCFGKFYESVGINFAGMAAICEGFTGEMAGGASFSKDSFDFEAISVLNDLKSASVFLEEVYMPWMMKFGQDMATAMAKDLGGDAKNLYVQTPDSTVDGYKVIGVKARFPFIAMPNGMNTPGMDMMINSETRMTTVGKLLLMASNDKRLSELIKIAKGLKTVPARGPFMTMDIDMTGYLDFIMDMMPMAPGSKRPLPKMGRITFLVDLKGGRASAKWSIMTDDIKALVASFKNVAMASSEKAPAGTETQRKAEEDTPEKKEEIDIVRHWFDRGMLFSTYGNHKKAVKSFKKVIELSPDNSTAHFNQGISYGELGEYEKAISSLDKALELSPKNGMYFYGRGRVYLLSGDKDNAIEDFKRAAALGNRDAQDYLESAAH